MQYRLDSEVGVIRRILNKRTLAVYFAVCLLLALVTEGTGGAADLLGGFVPAQGGWLNVLEIMRWNLGVLPPVGASVLFMDEELGTLRYFTLLRSGSVGRWCFLRFAAVGAANLAYLLMAEAVAVICTVGRVGWSWGSIENTIGNGAGSAVGDSVAVDAVRSVADAIGTATGNVVGDGNVGMGGFWGISLIFFLVHSFTMSAASAALLAWKGGPRAPVLLFLTVEGFLTAVGNLVPRVSAYLPPYWGMARQMRLGETGGVLYLLGTMGLQLALAACAVGYAAVRLRDGTRSERKRKMQKGQMWKQEHKRR